jgi:hypothetical protein
MKPATSILGLALALIAGYYSEPYVKGFLLPAASTVPPVDQVVVTPPKEEVAPTPPVVPPAVQETPPPVEAPKEEALPIPEPANEALPIPVEETTPSKPEESTPTMVVPDEQPAQPEQPKEATTTQELPSVAPIDLGGAQATEDQVISAMQGSIRSGAIREFSYDQVTQWQAGPAEEYQGASYQTGMASCKSETIFGTKVLGAKALIKDGKVVKWLWAKSGMEIK